MADLLVQLEQQVELVQLEVQDPQEWLDQQDSLEQPFLHSKWMLEHQQFSLQILRDLPQAVI